ncbi:MAG: spermidine synthase-like protein, partial [Bacteroidota bacterium]
VIRFDSYLLFVEGGQVRRLVLTYLTFFVPFFVGALALGLIFVRHVDRIGSVYFANLVGSGVGGLIALALLWLFMPQQLPSLVALLPIAAALFIIPSRQRSPLVLMAAVIAALAFYCIASSPQLNISDYKSIRRTLNLPDAKVVFERSSPHGLVQVVSSPALRYTPGLSLTYKDSVPSCPVVFNNGDWFGPLVAATVGGQVLRSTTLALPYMLKPRERVLVLNARTGMFVAQALENGALQVTAVEPHSTVLSLMQHELARQTDSLFFHPAVNVRNVDPRTFLMSDTSAYDLIVLPTLDAFGGTSGLYATQEQYLLTKEAVREMWQKLSPDGVICITSWMDYPVRNPLRALATLVETLSEAGVAKPAQHIAAIRSWGTITFVAKRTPLTVVESDSVKAFCERMAFDPALLPNLNPHERSRNNILQDESFFSLLDAIVSENRESVYAA